MARRNLEADSRKSIVYLQGSHGEGIEIAKRPHELLHDKLMKTVWGYIGAASEMREDHNNNMRRGGNPMGKACCSGNPMKTT